MKQNSKKTLTPQTYSLDIHSHTHTLTLCCVFKELCVFFAVSHSVCFALRPREHTRIRIHKSLSAYEQGGRGRGRGGQHTHITVRHSSHKQLSRNHNKFTSAAQMFDKKFCEKLSLISQHLNDFSATLGVGGEREGGGAQSWLF